MDVSYIVMLTRVIIVLFVEPRHLSERKKRIRFFTYNIYIINESVEK